MEQVELSLSNLLLALQVCLGIWQFIKLTPVGALIKGFVGWSLRPLGLSTTYTLLQRCRGRVFKKVNSYVLQADLPSQRRDSQAGRRDTMKLYYLGGTFLLERRGSEMNMLFIDGIMRYYITPQIWDELETLTHVLNVDILAAFFPDAADNAAAPIVAATAHCVGVVDAFDAVAAIDPADAADFAAAAHATSFSVFLKGQRQFWEATSTGGVMTLEEVLDEVILYNKHVGARLGDDWLLPVNLSVSEEKLLKLINLIGLFLQTKKVSVYWLIPTSLSFISALLEFSSTIRVWIYEHINLCFCYMMHFICDPLPRSWRRQVYSFGNWVENLKPCNDMELKIVRGNMCATIAGGAKVDKQGATLVPWLNPIGADEAHQRNGRVDREFRCNPIGIDIKCVYLVRQHLCYLSAPTITEFRVDCNSSTEFEKIITFVSSIAKNSCGSLKCYGPHKKVSVRGFRESVIFYIKSGFPLVYELELDNVVVA